MNLCDLPKELRDIIWGFVVRSGRPGVHFFSLSCGRFKSYDSPVNPRDECRVFGVKYTSEDDTSLDLVSAPIGHSGTTQASWTRNNSSTYLSHGALWTTCRESREVIASAYRKRRYHTSPQNYDSRDHTRNKHDGRSGFFLNDQNEVQYFTVLRHDLVCFRVFDFKFLYLDGTTTPLAQSKKAWNGDQGAEHVAVEFDPSWRVPQSQNFPRRNSYPRTAETTLASMKLHFTDLWLIDYRIKRLSVSGKQSSRVQDDRMGFYGTGFRLREVYHEDDEWEFRNGPSTSNGMGIFDFIDEIEEEAFPVWEREQTDCESEGEEREPDFARIRVLAYQME